MSTGPEIVELEDVRISLKKLPKQVRQLYTQQLIRLKDSLKDPRLHLKKLRGLEEIFSFRITRNYRALFYFQYSNQIIIFAIGNRKDIYR